MRHIFATCMVGLVILSCAAVACAANPFMKGTSRGEQHEKVQAVVHERPSLFQQVYSRIVSSQRDLRQGMSSYVRRLKSAPAPLELLTFLALAFAYGVIHAAGPGHGKSVASSYFLSRGGRMRQGVALGLTMGAIHAISAIVVVGGVYFFVQRSLMASFARVSGYVEQGSYLLVGVVGLVLLAQAVRESFGEDAAEAAPPAPRSLFAVALSAGIIPCPGAALILLFAIAQQALWLGLSAVTAMAAGMGVTIATASVCAVCFRSATLCTSSRHRRTMRVMRGIFSILGALVVVGFGFGLFVGSL